MPLVRIAYQDIRGAMGGELTFAMDDRNGLIRVRGVGMWTAEQADAHFIELRRAIEGLRAIRRPVLVLVDLSAANVQTGEVAEAISDGTARIYRDADFVALVAGTALLGLQMKRAAKVPNFAVFSELRPALDWLALRRADVHA